MLDNDPLWYRDAIIYEVHVRAFHDSVGDGIGDFRGLTQKLDYLHDLGITAIWLLPFYPSPLRDDGYDIGDYTDIHASYGTLRDFQDFLTAAHQRGLRVITELVVNHTSDQHAWFQRARRAPKGSVERDFYVWSDTQDKYRDARIIFKDFERSNWSWDPVANAYYWHRFYSHQPDLNFDNPAVWQALVPVVDFWLGMGVDGMRLDAVPYLFERDGTNCENLPETHKFLQFLRRHIDSKYGDRMLLAEANQWPEDAVAYFGDGDECHMAFHFPIMPRMFMALHMEDRFPILDILDQTPAIPTSCQWCLFLRNHDELTLEMVTDEERDYMYRAYAHDPQARINLGIRHRLAPLLANNRRRIELMNALLLSMPGTPVIYYGDEIGMGDNIYLGDRNGVRTPMQWSGDRNAGFSRANPQRLYLPVIIDPEYHFEALNVEAQQNNPSSLLWWMKRLLALRKQTKAFGRGSFEMLKPANSKILAFLRRYGEERILVVANLSRFVQYVELDLSEFRGLVPQEMLGGTLLPQIGELPYLLTLGPHAFYWFQITASPQPRHTVVEHTHGSLLPQLSVTESWEELFTTSGLPRLARSITNYMGRRVAEGDFPRPMRSATLKQSSLLKYGDIPFQLSQVDIEYADGNLETRVVPIAFAGGERVAYLTGGGSALAEIRREGQTIGVLFDARTDPTFAKAALGAIRDGWRKPMADGEIVATPFPRFASLQGGPGEDLAASVCFAPSRNTSVIFGERLILKMFESLADEPNPDLEIGRFLTEHTNFDGTSPIAGAIEFRGRRGKRRTLAVLHGYVPNQGDAWHFTLDTLSRFFENVLALRTPPPPGPLLETWFIDTQNDRVGLQGHELINSYVRTVEQLGQLTARMHAALASHPDDPEFAPEPFSKLYQRSIYQSMRNQAGTALRDLRQSLFELEPQTRLLAEQVLPLEAAILEKFRSILDYRFSSKRIRIHGDFHLGELLFTGNSFVVIDFEGDPRRPVSERRIKRSPLRDVASMVQSFHTAAFGALFGAATVDRSLPGVIRPEDALAMEQWARFWYQCVASRYIAGYVENGDVRTLIDDRPTTQALFEALMLERAIEQLSFDLDYRRPWVRVSLLQILELLVAAASP